MVDTVATLADIIVYGSTNPIGGAGGGGGVGSQPGKPAISREEVMERLERTYPETCGQKGKEDFRIDGAFISAREGQNVPSGYVPTTSSGAPVGDSGVTIGIGVDLGARNITDLNRLGLTPPVKALLTPYLGLKGAAAQAYLASHPLTLNTAQLGQLNNKVHNEIYSNLQQRFEQGSSFKFWRLPSAAQTVLASVALQYGPNLQTEAPIFLGHMRAGRWSAAVAELRNYGDNYPTRRNLEADVLQGAIDNGEIPNQC